MKKLYVLMAACVLMGCAEKKPLTPEEQWQGYCRSVGNAARSIMLDRQNGILKDQAVEHANKVEDETTRKFVLSIIEQVYALSADQIKADTDLAQDQIRAEFTQKCIATPHAEMPEYKPF